MIRQLLSTTFYHIKLLPGRGMTRPSTSIALAIHMELKENDKGRRYSIRLGMCNVFYFYEMSRTQLRIWPYSGEQAMDMLVFYPSQSS